MMTKKYLKLISLWAGLDKEVREAIEYKQREGKSECELWISSYSEIKKILKALGFEIEVITKEGIVKEYIKISWDKMKEE